MAGSAPRPETSTRSSRPPSRGTLATIFPRLFINPVNMNIPGIGVKKRPPGKGLPGTNGGAAGDLLVTTKIEKHPYYKRKGADVLLSMPVSPAEAALGAAIVVPAPDGTKVRVKVPAGTQSGTVLSVRGKGAPKVKGSGTGDLKITVEVQTPTTMNDEQTKAMEDYLAATETNVRPW